MYCHTGVNTKSKRVRPRKATTTLCRPTHDTLRKRHSAPTATGHQHDRGGTQSRATSFPQQNQKRHKVLHSKQDKTQNPTKQLEQQKTINQQRQNHRLRTDGIRTKAISPLTLYPIDEGVYLVRYLLRRTMSSYQARLVSTNVNGLGTYIHLNNMHMYLKKHTLDTSFCCIHHASQRSACILPKITLICLAHTGTMFTVHFHFVGPTSVV